MVLTIDREPGPVSTSHIRLCSGGFVEKNIVMSFIIKDLQLKFSITFKSRLVPFRGEHFQLHSSPG